jgi:hypothetical protein
MTETRIRGEQLRFLSSTTGSHILDDYLEAAEIGGRTLADLLGDVYAPGDGSFRFDIFEFREDPSNPGDLQFRVGDFVDPNVGWATLSSSDFAQFVSDAQAARDAAAASAASAAASASDPNVITVSTNIANINAVAADISNVNTVVTNIANVNAVAADAADIGAVAANIANIGAVVTNATNINEVAGISANVTTVAGDTLDIQALGPISTDIATVAGISLDVTAVAADATDIGTVATNISNVNDVATNIANVNAAASNAANINAVVADAVDIGNVSGSIANVNSVAANLAAISSVNLNAANINTVSAADANITAVAGSIANVNTVATNLININAVAGIDADVTAVAGNSANVTTVAANISSIDNFADRYQIATGSDPTLRADGSALQAGDLLYRSDTDTTKVYTGTSYRVAVFDVAGAVFGPVSTTDNYVPQWNGAGGDSLKAGLAVGTGANRLLQLDGSGRIPAINGSLLTSLTKSQVGLANVDNTSDASKPISTATQTALDGKAASSHTHAISDVTNLQTSLDGKAASGHTHSNATTGASGFMSAADKTKLDAVGTMANRAFTVSTLDPSGGANGDIWFKVT